MSSTLELLLFLHLLWRRELTSAPSSCTVSSSSSSCSSSSDASCGAEGHRFSEFVVFGNSGPSLAGKGCSAAASRYLWCMFALVYFFFVSNSWLSAVPSSRWCDPSIAILRTDRILNYLRQIPGTFKNWSSVRVHLENNHYRSFCWGWRE